MQNKPQTQVIVEFMTHYGSITPLDALNYCQCFRLASRIKDLRNQGYQIQTDMIKDKGKKYASYKLIQNGQLVLF